jgi:FAD:protein FMN transferase
MSTHVEHVMGMAVSIDLRDPTPDERGAVRAVVRWLHSVDATFSTYRPDSPISRMARGELTFADAPPLVRYVLSRCRQFKATTDGYFDVRAGGTLDPSGFVKGWAVEQASLLLSQAGCENHLVNAGGDIRARGRPATGRRWRVGISHPLVRDALCAVVEVDERGGGVATSGIAERGAHVVDPHTGKAALDLASVTVVGRDVITADVYATAALAMGLAAPVWLASRKGYQAYIVDTTGNEWSTPGWSRHAPASAVAV